MHIRKTALLALPVLAATLAPRLAPAQVLSLRPSLQVGDQFELELIRSREDAARPQSNGKSRTVIHVAVLEAGAKGFLLEWRQGATSYNNPDIVKNPVAAAAANAFKDMRLEVILGPNGNFTGLRNQEEVTAKLQSALDSMLSTLVPRVENPQERKTAEAIVRRLMSPQILLSTAASDVQTYFGVYGLSVSKGKPVENIVQQTSPLGPGAIPATFRLTLETLDAHQATLTSTTSHDPRVLAELTKQLLAKAPPGSVSNPPPTLEMSDLGRYVYNRAFGLMNEVNIARRVTVGPGTARIDGRQIRLLTRPTR